MPETPEEGTHEAHKVGSIAEANPVEETCAQRENCDRSEEVGPTESRSGKAQAPGSPVGNLAPTQLDHLT